MNIQRKNSAHHFCLQSEREQTLVTNFPEICAFIIGFNFTVWTKKSATKVRKQEQNAYKICIYR